MSLKIITDSGCDLSREIMDDLDIVMLPLNVLEGDSEYRDKETITPRELYKGMREGKFYQTSQTLPNVIIDRITRELDKGNDIIYICFSSGLSGQYQTSVMLFEDINERYKDRKIDLIDSKSACCGMGMMVKKAGEMAKNGESREEILKMLDHYIENINHVIIVDKMDFLYKGGRINKVQALTGGLLNLKPIVGMDKLGKLEFIDKIRGRKRLLKRVEEIINEKNTGDIEDQEIGLVYGDNDEMASEFKEFLIDKFNPSNIIVENVGASVSAHTGPDIIGITFLNKKYK